MHTPEYTQSLMPKIPVIGQNWLSLLLVHPLKGLPEEPDVPSQAMLITDEYTTIGRSSTCQVMIKERFISRVHATIWREAATQGVVYWLHDGDLQESKPSSNGTLLKGERLQWPCQLADAAWIQLGNRIFLSFHEVRLPTPSEQQRHEVLADLLVEAGLISLAQLQMARATMKERACLLGEVLVQEKFLSSQTLEFMDQIDTITLPLGAGKPPLGEYLKAAGLVTEEQMNAALQMQKRNRIYFGLNLVKEKILSEATLDFFMKRYQHLDRSFASTMEQSAMGSMSS